MSISFFLFYFVLSSFLSSFLSCFELDSIHVIFSLKISLAIQDVDNEREQEIEEINGEKEGHKERSMRKIDEGNDELDENEELGEEEEEEEDDEEDDEEEQNGSVGTDKSLRENHAGIEDTGRASDVEGLRYGGVTGVNEIVLEPKLNIGRKEFFERIEKRIQKGEELPNEFWTKSFCAASQGICVSTITVCFNVLI